MSDPTNEFGPTTSVLQQILQKHEEQLLDLNKHICMLCRRMFKDNDQLMKHQSLSDMHSNKLKRLKNRIFIEEQLISQEKRDKEALYRDRAKERRLKYGQPDRMIPLEPILPAEATNPKVIPNNQQKTPVMPLSRDNKGAALLSKMGWREGTGLGKNSEGMTDILKIESQVGTSGLGSKSHRIDPNLSYKEAVKKIMYQRYYEISSGEEDNQEQDL